MKFDLQDALLVVGVGSIEGGISMWSRPAAFVVFGVICLVGVLLIQRTKGTNRGVNDGSSR